MRITIEMAGTEQKVDVQHSSPSGYAQGMPTQGDSDLQATDAGPPAQSLVQALGTGGEGEESESSASAEREAGESPAWLRDVIDGGGGPEA